MEKQTCKWLSFANLHQQLLLKPYPVFHMRLTLFATLAVFSALRFFSRSRITYLSILFLSTKRSTGKYYNAFWDWRFDRDIWVSYNITLCVDNLIHTTAHKVVWFLRSSPFLLYLRQLVWLLHLFMHLIAFLPCVPSAHFRSVSIDVFLENVPRGFQDTAGETKHWKQSSWGQN